MKNSQRTLLGVAAFVPLAVILLATLACLPAPVGDPEKSKVDAALTGLYKAQTQAANAREMAELRPWDDKTYLVTYLQVHKNEGKEEQQISLYKGWLTTLAEKTFLTLQPMADSKAQVAAPEKPFWIVMRLDKTADGMEARVVNEDSEFLKGLTKREELEAAIKAHVSDVGLYREPLAFKKLGQAEQAFIDEMRGKFGLKGP